MIGEKNFYKLSDAAIKLLDGRLAKRAQKARQRMIIADFDELNVIQTINALYKDLFADNEEIYAELMRLVWAKAGGKGTPPSKEWLRRRVLKAYDPVTLYVYLYEEERKRDRTIEAINSSVGGRAKKKAFSTALRYWHDMTVEYSDQVTFETVVDAFQSQGVEFVVWRTQEDERVCETCAPRDGQIYDIANVPRRPHWNCRCTIEPYYG